MGKYNTLSALLSAIADAIRSKTGGETAIAAKIRKAVDEVLAEKQHLTPDLGGSATTEEYRDAVIAKL